MKNKGIWKRLPFARPLVCSLTGILLDEYLDPDYRMLACSLFLVLVLLVIFHCLPLWLRWKLSAFNGMTMMTLLTVAASLHHSLNTGSVPGILKTDHGCILRIEESKETAQSIRYTAGLFVVENNRPAKKGRCYVYLKKESKKKVQHGDLVFCATIPKKITNSNNPGSFDFVAFASRKGIYYTVYLGPTTPWILLHRTEQKHSLMERTKDRILSILRKHFPNKMHLGLAEAMLIGYRNDLDNTLLNAYIDTGVVHIIAISGLHLGLIFMFLDKIVVLLLGKKRSAFGALVIIIPLLWGFAFITGGSASVLRSALMFSMMIVAKAIGRKNASMNALLGSAFILLLYDSKLVHDLGFQLSYTAVGSIVLFDGWIKKWLYLSNPLARHAWDMISITLAAQVLTTPLILMHFHRFPLLFLFANLVAVPLSSIILVAEIVLVALHQSNLLASWLTSCTVLLIEWMNSYVFMISTVPHAVIEQLYLSTPMAVLCYLLIFSMAACIKAPGKLRWYIFLGLLLLSALLRIAERIKLHNKRSIVVLHLPRESCIMVQYGTNGTLYLREALLKDQQKLTSLMLQTAKGTGICRWKILLMPSKPLLVSVKKTIPMVKFRKTGCVVLTGSAARGRKILLNDVLASIPRDWTIVVDGSNTLWKIREWEKEAHELHLRLHPTPDKGAYTFP